MEKSKFDLTLYQRNPQIVLGFHGCDKKVADRILNSPKEHLTPSEHDYDWLGDGIYFWLNDPKRAYEWAEHKRERDGEVENPAVIGAISDLGVCLNLSERQSVELIQKSYSDLKEIFASAGYDLNEVKKNKVPDKGGFNLIRPLDCAVIKHAHKIVKDRGVVFDTVYGYFQEGEDAYLGAGIKEKSHVQICVRNKSCIKGYFLPREL